MPRKNKVIHISNLPSTFRGNVTRNGRFIQNGIPPLGGAYDKIAKSTGLIRLGNEFLYNGINNLVSKDNREKLMNNTAGRLINYVKDFNKESFPSDDELGPTFPFNIIQTPRSNGKKLPQKQYAVGGKIPNVVAGGIAQPLGNNFFYMNGRKHSQGGIDIGPSDKTGIEVEDGEVVETNGNELKVYSAQPIINGISPAKLVMGGANPNKVFKAQEDFKNRNRINDDGTKKKQNGGKTPNRRKYTTTLNNDEEKQFQSWYSKVAKYKNLNPNPDADGQDYDYRGYWKNEDRNGILGSNPNAHFTDRYKQPTHPTFSNESQYSNNETPGGTWVKGKGTWLFKHNKYTARQAKRTADYLNGTGEGYILGTDTIIPNRRKKMGGLNRKQDYGSKSKPYPKVKTGDFAGNGRSYPIPTKADAVDALRLAGLHGRSDVKAKVYNKYPELRKKGNTGLIVNISGNVKNGLIHSPSSTGGLRDKSARGETIVGSDYTFRNGRWSKNNNVNTNNNKLNIDNGNRRPQYYAERRLPLFEDGAGITSGLVRAGWSHGNNRGISTNNTNIPSLSETKSSRKTPRGGRSKSSQSTQSVPTKTPPIAVYNRNLPKVEASIPTTLPVSTNIPAKGTTSSDGKGQGKFKNLATADWIGLGSNVAGSLASYFASRRAINKMRGPGQPTLISASKLKTKYNINPQLDRIREDKFEAYRDIDSNTASSRVSLARKQRVRNAAGQAANELYGNKENIETNLINQDRRNQQSVRQFNAQQYNQYIDRKAAFDNGIREAKVTNINNLFSGINAGIQDMISRYENRKALNNTIGAMRASAPNVDDRIMRDAGVDYDEFIIRKRRKLGGKQSCR